MEEKKSPGTSSSTPLKSVSRFQLFRADRTSTNRAEQKSPPAGTRPFFSVFVVHRSRLPLKKNP